MIVKTKNPIRIISNTKDNYSNIDAKNKEEVKDFQRYAVSRGANLDYISKLFGEKVSDLKDIKFDDVLDANDSDEE